MELSVIRKIQVVTTETGAATAATALDKLAGAQAKVGDTAAKMGGSTETASKKVTSSAGAFDRLSQSIDAQYRAQVQFERGQRTINAALSQGIVTSEQAALRMDQLRAKYLANDNAAAALGKTSGAVKAQIQGLGYQVNDVATMALSGASPFQILATQGGQFLQIMQQGEGGIAGTFSKLSAGLMALVTPANVALAGVAALGTAFLAYAAISRETLPSLDDQLKEHADLIGRIRTAFGEAAIAADTYGKESRAVFEAGLKGDIRGFQDQLKAATDDFYNSVTMQQSRSRSGMGPRVVTGEFSPFADEIEALRKSVAAGAPEVRKFRQDIADAIKAEPASSELRKLGENLLDSTEKLAKIDGKLDQAKGTLSNFGSAAAMAGGGVAALNKSLSELVALATPEESRFDKIDRLTRESIAASPGIGGIQGALAARQGALQRLADENMPTPRPKPNRLGDVSGYETALESAREQMRQAGDALLIYDKGAAAIEAYRMQETILQAAQKEGMTVTADQMAGVQALTDSYAALLRERDKLKIDGDLTFERDQLGRSATDQKVATTLRGIYGAEYTSHMSDGLANRIRENAALKEMSEAAEKARKSMMDFQRDTAGGFLKDLYSGLRQGKDGFDALADAALNAGDKIANKLFDKATDSIVSALFPDTSKTGNGTATSGGAADISSIILEALKPKASHSTVSDLARGSGLGKITGLNDNFRSGLTSMIGDAAKAGFDIDINSGFRSIARQQELWDAALKKYGSPELARKWVAPPGRSMHNFGQAADLGYNTPGAMDWAHQNASRYGLTFPLSNENWHIEPIGGRSGGMGAAADAAGRSLKSMSEAAAGTAQATAGLGGSFSNLAQGLSQAFSSLAGGKGGDFSGLANLVSGIADSNWAKNLMHSVTPGATGWQFADGGYTGPGGKHQAAGIVHRGEVVWSQSDVARAGGVHVVEGMRRGLPGYADGGVVDLMGAERRAAQVRAAVAGKGGAGGGVTFVLEDHSSGKKSTTMNETTRPDGTREIRAVMNDAMADAINQRGGSTDRALSARGAVPRTRKLG
jgi:hypothetical protein